jgi:uroporphyrinogen-III decarboxylase
MIEPRVLERDGRFDTFVDGWGLVTRRWVDRDGVPQVLRPAINETEELDGYFQDPDLQERYEGLDQSVQGLHSRGHPAIVTISDHWGGLYHMFGVKRLLKMVHMEAGLIREAVRRLARHYDQVVANVLDHDIDGLWVFGDLASNGGPFIPPRMYESLFFRPHRSMFRHVTSKGLPVIFHSDGDITRLIPYLIDEGVSAIQPLDAFAGMDVLELKERYGDVLAFMGNIPNKTLLPRGTPGQVAEEVKRKLVAGAGGGYILGSAHSVASDVPPDNFDAMVAAAKKYGRHG